MLNSTQPIKSDVMLLDRMKASVEAYKKMPRLERAIMDLEQRRSFVIGMSDLPRERVNEILPIERVNEILDNFPEFIVLDELIKLRRGK